MRSVKKELLPPSNQILLHLAILSGSACNPRINEQLSRMLSRMRRFSFSEGVCSHEGHLVQWPPHHHFKLQGAAYVRMVHHCNPRSKTTCTANSTRLVTSGHAYLHITKRLLAVVLHEHHTASSGRRAQKSWHLHLARAPTPHAVDGDDSGDPIVYEQLSVQLQLIRRSSRHRKKGCT